MNFVDEMEKRINAAMECISRQLDYGIWGQPMIGHDEWLEYQRSRSSARFMMKILMEIME